MINVCTFDDTTNFLNSIVSKKQLVSNLNKKCSIYVLYLVGIQECFEGTFDFSKLTLGRKVFTFEKRRMRKRITSCLLNWTFHYFIDRNTYLILLTIHWQWHSVNSHLTRWFSTINDPFMSHKLCLYQVLNEVVSQKFFKRLPFKLNSAAFDDISLNRKLNFKSPLHQKW